jgi:hypothetical protein
MTKIELTAGNYWSIHVSEVTKKKEFCLQEPSHKNCSTCQKKNYKMGDDMHCISKGKIGHIRTWNSRVQFPIWLFYTVPCQQV